VTALVYGVDGCRGRHDAAGRSWLVVGLDDHGEFGSAAVAESFAGVVDHTRDGELILVDIPIGLPDAERPTRTCDGEARRLIGPRFPSVFSAPARAALQAADHREASERNRRAIGKGLSKQAWAICPRISDVDAVLRAPADLQGRYRESHPELCFAALNSWRPAAFAKSKPEGREERRAALIKYRGNAAEWFERTCGLWPRSRVDPTDVLDGMVLALTAGLALSRNCPTVPAHPPIDAAGLRMEMVCPIPMP